MKNILSIIIPCFNEAEIIETSESVIEKCLEEINYEYEIIFIDDGSKDRTKNILRKLSRGNKDIKYISFSRNFGKEAAMVAGLEYCIGECAIIMDADLQHPPELIKIMLEKYEEGYDQVIARRDRNGDSRWGTFCAKSYYKIVNKIVNVEMIDGAGDFRLLSRRAINALLSLKERNRFSKGLFSWIGFRQIYIEYENRERVGGESKWTFRRLLSYGIDGILSFNNQPLRICIYLGIGLVGIGIVYLVYLFIRIVMYGVDAPGYFTTILLITCLGGAQLLSLGVIGEYIGRIYNEVKNRPNYLVEESNIMKL